MVMRYFRIARDVGPVAPNPDETYHELSEMVDAEVIRTGLKDDHELELYFDVFLSRKYGRPAFEIKQDWEKQAEQGEQSYYELEMPDFRQFIVQRMANIPAVSQTHHSPGGAE